MKNILDKSYLTLRGIFLDNIRPGKNCRILDIGCGRRGNIFRIESRTYLGIDNDPHTIKRLKDRTDGTYALMDAGKMDFPAETFDYIISTSFFHHISDEEVKRVSSMMKKILKSKGKLIIADGVYPDSRLNVAGRMIRFLDRGRHVRDKEGFRRIFSGDFRIKNEYYFTELIFSYSVLVMEK